MQEELQILKDCVLIQYDAKNKEEVINELSSRLKRNGIVKENFEKAVLNREYKYPTGLKIGKHNIAIPHTEPQFVNEPGVGIAVLKEKIAFHRMDSSDDQVEVDIVLLLALNQGHSHMDVLSKIIAMCQDEAVLDALIASKNEATIVDIVRKRLSGGKKYE